MISDKTIEKLEILADAAKYDVSCASSGSKRKNTNLGLGNSTGMGICHTYTQDGRCVSLLKILLTNHCIFDCAYCVSRRSNDVKRAAFTVKEVVDLTLSFYKRNYIEGLFLSSGIFKNADYTMERLIRIARDLRESQDFNGYVHLKAIPGASDELISEAGKYADRLSVNIEIPSEESLKKVAPEKNFDSVFQPMDTLKNGILESKTERKKHRKAPLFAPGGQSTQMVIGATPEDDYHILNLADDLYRDKNLKRVYYSGYVPIQTDQRIPEKLKVPRIRENRLYQADWLMRFYQYKVDEIIDDQQPFLDLQMDPKLAYALRNFHLFPMDINAVDYSQILRIPGIGIKSAKKIWQARKFTKLREYHLKSIGVVWSKAKYFVKTADRTYDSLNFKPETIKAKLIKPSLSPLTTQQLSLF